MILRKRTNFINRSDFALTAANFPAQQLKVPIDRTWPLEEIQIVVTAVCKSTFVDQKGYGILNLLKHVNLSINDGTQPRSVVDVTGPGVLQYACNAGLNMDRSTAGAVATSLSLNTASMNGPVATGVYRITYRLPMVHPAVTDDLRPRMLLPIHVYPQDPVLTLDFAAATEVSTAQGDPWTSVNVEIVLIRRDMPQSVHDSITQSGGYIKFDLIESIFTFPNNLSAVEQRIALPMPGQYTGLLIHHQDGDLKPTDLSASTTIGSETRWRIETGGIFLHEWRQKHLQILNDQSRPMGQPACLIHPLANASINSLTALGVTGGAPPVWVTAKQLFTSNNFGGILKAGLTVQDASSVYLDFLTDGSNDVTELGSLLDCNLPANQGLKMEIIGSMTTTGTNNNTVSILGHRLFGDLSKYQALSSVK